MPLLDRGRIVHVEMPDPQGRNVKACPAVVITTAAEIAADGEVDLVAISSRFDAAPAEVQGDLPWQAQGRCPTKLTKPSVAICTWLLTVPAAAIRHEDMGGVVPAGKLLQILQKVEALTKEEPPDEGPKPPASDA